ncbi:MAG: T9SS type A sorting domain-containing protein [Bacteroidota bacterium]|nr:T9SS type A sorting domain-containing protein [Bacteroidota bacterium]
MKHQILALLLFLFAAAITEAQTPAAWPGSGSNTGISWVAYRDANNNLIQDPNDMSPDHIDLYYSAADPSSVSVAYDGGVTFYRFQLEASPIGSNGNWNNGTWIVQFGSVTSGYMGAVYVNVVGNSGSVAVTDGSNVDVIYSFSANNTAPGGARVMQVPNASTYYLDFQVPMAALWSGTNTQLGLTASTIQSFFYGTSTAAGNPGQISKDFMVGAAVDFTTLTQTGFTMIGTGVLPVELTSFTAYRKTDAVELRWNTATEIDNYGFAVERAVEDGAWTEIAFIPGAGNSNAPRNYGYGDHAFPRNSAHISYRLRQVDRDGSSEYSPVVMVRTAAAAGIGITDAYPNPFNPSTTVSFSVAQDGPVRLELLDVTGRSVMTVLDAEHLSAGTHARMLNAGQLPSGRYFLLLSSAEVNSVHAIVLMK